MKRLIFVLAAAAMMFAAPAFAQKPIPVTPLDETFDVGEDTGTPVLEEYADKMPFRFTGKLERLAVVLQPDKLSAEEKERLHKELSKAMMSLN